MKLIALYSPLEGKYPRPVLPESVDSLEDGWQDSKIRILLLQLNLQHCKLPAFLRGLALLRLNWNVL